MANEIKMRSFTLRDGGNVYPTAKVNKILSAGKREKLTILQKALEGFSVPTDRGDFLEIEIDLGWTIGASEVLLDRKITPSQSALFGRRLGVVGPSRIAEVWPSRISKATGITVVLKKIDSLKNTWQLLNFWYGKKIPKEPWDPSLTEEEREISLNFWCEHAFRPDIETTTSKFISTWDEESKIIRGPNNYEGKTGLVKKIFHLFN